MAAQSWRIEDARKHLDEVIAAAEQGEQRLTRDGQEVAVVLSASQFAALTRGTDKTPSFTEWLLAIPKFADEEEEREAFERPDIRARDIDLSD